MPVWTDPQRSNSEMVLSLYRWWLGKRGTSDVPDRSTVDPAELKKLLPNILIAEAMHKPFRVRYRLVGTRVNETAGFNIQSRYLDELLSAEPDQPWMDHYRSVYVNRRPLLGATSVPTSGGGDFTYEFGVFPLRNGGDTIEQFIAVEDYFGLQSTIVQLQPWSEKR